MATRTWTADEVRALGVTTTVGTAGDILGLSRGAAYKLARNGEFPVPVITMGTRYSVPVAPILETLGLGLATAAAGVPTSA